MSFKSEPIVVIPLETHKLYVAVKRESEEPRVEISIVNDKEEAVVPLQTIDAEHFATVANFIQAVAIETTPPPPPLDIG